MTEPLPWPADRFLADAAVRHALSRGDYDLVVFLPLFASACWVAEDSTSLPSEESELAAALGLSRAAVRRAVPFWREKGKLRETRDAKRLHLPWLTRAKTAAQQAALMVAKDRDEQEEWPKNYTEIACDAWVCRFGSGSAPGDVIAHALREIKKGGAPWNAVIRSFRRYVAKTKLEHASPQFWRKRWRGYDPEEPEHDPEAADIADSWDRQLRRRGRGGGPVSAGKALREGERSR